MSLGIHRRYDFDDWASAHGRLPPWSDDATTSHYQSPLPPRAATLRMVPPPAPEPVLDARAAQRRLANAYYQPPVQRTAAAPRAVPQPVQPPASVELEDNPFARPSVLGPLAALGVASVALFAAVFATRVLMAAATAAPAAPSVAPPAPVVPAAEAAAPPALPPTAASEEPAPAVESPTERTPSARERRHTASRSSRHEATEAAEAAEATDSAPREEAPARADDAAPATLRINSLPWSQVYLDGKLLGNTPLRGIQVPAGTHTLRLVNSEFGMVKTRPVTAAAGEVVTLVEMLDE